MSVQLEKSHFKILFANNFNADFSEMMPEQTNMNFSVLQFFCQSNKGLTPALRAPGLFDNQIGDYHDIAT